MNRKSIESEQERATKNAKDAALHEYMNRLSCETEQTKELVGRPASTVYTKQRRAPHSKRGHLPLNLNTVLRALILSYKEPFPDDTQDN